MPASWTQPICERDWIEQNATYDEEGILETIRMPYRLNEPDIEQCAFCGGPTIFGVFTRVDPKTVPYPRSSDD